MSDLGNAFVIDCSGGSYVLVRSVDGRLKFAVNAADGENLGYFSATEATVRKLIPFMQAWLGKRADEKPVTP